MISAATIQCASHSRPVDLHALNLYHQMLVYLRELWSADIKLAGDTEPVAAGEPFTTHAVRSVDFATVNGIRYGVTNKHQGKGYRHAYVNGRQPVRIAHIMRVKIFRRDTRLPALEHVCAYVEPFKAVRNCPRMPWDLRYVPQLP